MAEIGVIASVVTLVDLSAKICKFLADFDERASNIETTAKDLQARVTTTRQRAKVIEGILSDRKQQSAELSRQEISVQKLLNVTLKKCRRSLTDFERALVGLADGKQDYTWLKRALEQRKYDKKDRQILRLEKILDRHNEQLHFLTTSLSL